MGLMDRQRVARNGADDEVADSGGHYVTKLFPAGGMTQGAYDRALNSHYDKGYRLSHIYEVGGQTVMVFERRAS